MSTAVPRSATNETTTDSPQTFLAFLLLLIPIVAIGLCFLHTYLEAKFPRYKFICLFPIRRRNDISPDVQGIENTTTLPEIYDDKPPDYHELGLTVFDSPPQYESKDSVLKIPRPNTAPNINYQI